MHKKERPPSTTRTATPHHKTVPDERRDICSRIIIHAAAGIDKTPRAWYFVKVKKFRLYKFKTLGCKTKHHTENKKGGRQNENNHDL